MTETAGPPLVSPGAAEIAEQLKWRVEHTGTYEHIWATWIFVAGAPVSFPRLQMVAEYQTRDPRYVSPGRLRWHETHCLFNYTLAGSGYFQDAAGRYSVGPGEGFLCLIDDPHSVYGYGDAAGQTWRFLSVGIDGEATRLLVRDLVRAHGPVFRLPPDAAVLHQLRGLERTASEMLQLSLTSALELACSLLVALEQSAQRVEEENAELLMQKAMHRLSLQAHLPEVSVLAASLNVSREHFSRVFRQHTGMPPQQWIERERIRRACHLLATTELSCKQIAHQLGYEHTGSFTRAFRRSTNLTPQQFRHPAPAPDEA